MEVITSNTSRILKMFVKHYLNNFHNAKKYKKQYYGQSLNPGDLILYTCRKTTVFGTTKFLNWVLLSH